MIKILLTILGGSHSFHSVGRTFRVQICPHFWQFCKKIPNFLGFGQGFSAIWLSKRVSEPLCEVVHVFGCQFLGIEDVVWLLGSFAIDAKPTRELLFGDRLLHVLL
jgi:hypothetical protein